MSTWCRMSLVSWTCWRQRVLCISKTHLFVQMLLRFSGVDWDLPVCVDKFASLIQQQEWTRARTIIHGNSRLFRNIATVSKIVSGFRFLSLQLTSQVQRGSFESACVRYIWFVRYVEGASDEFPRRATRMDCHYFNRLVAYVIALSVSFS